MGVLTRTMVVLITILMKDRECMGIMGISRTTHTITALTVIILMTTSVIMITRTMAVNIIMRVITIIPIRIKTILITIISTVHWLLRPGRIIYH